MYSAHRSATEQSIDPVAAGLPVTVLPMQDTDIRKSSSTVALTKPGTHSECKVEGVGGGAHANDCVPCYVHYFV